MLTERIVKTKKVKYLTLILREIEERGAQKNRWWNCIKTGVSKDKLQVRKRE